MNFGDTILSDNLLLALTAALLRGQQSSILQDMNKLVKHCLAALAATLGLWTTGALAQNAEPKVLNIYNWSDYIAEDTIKNFEKETGIKVRYDNYDTNEILHAKLVAGKSGYDIVVPSAHFAKKQIEAGLFQQARPLAADELEQPRPGAAGAAGQASTRATSTWWTGCGATSPWASTYRQVKKALGDLPMPENPWSLIFDPKYASKLKSCGVNFLDSASEVLPVALLYVGKPATAAMRPTTTPPARC